MLSSQTRQTKMKSVKQLSLKLVFALIYNNLKLIIDPNILRGYVKTQSGKSYPNVWFRVGGKVSKECLQYCHRVCNES